jgi:hypothetical protein
MRPPQRTHAAQLLTHASLSPAVKATGPKDVGLLSELFVDGMNTDQIWGQLKLEV